MTSALLDIFTFLLLALGISVAVVLGVLVLAFLLLFISGIIDWFIGNRRK